MPKNNTRRSKDESSYHNYLNSGSYYANTSAARKIAEPDEEYVRAKSYSTRTHAHAFSPAKRETERRKPLVHTHDERRLARKNRRKTVKQNRKNAQKAIYEYAVSKTRNASFMTYLMVGVVFIGSVMCCFTFAAKSSSLLTLNQMKTEYKKLQDDNANLTRENYEGLNLAEITDLAKRIGMGEPQEHQKVYFDVPNDSYVVQYDNEELEKGSFKLNLGNIFKSLSND